RSGAIMRAAMDGLPARPLRRPGRGLSPALVAGLVALAAGCARPAPRPSLLLVTIDTLRADHLGCYGYPRPTSPRIDRLAASGALFERTFTSLPRTTQSIASIMTGRFPKGHQARGLYSALSPANLTLAEILKGEGYETAAIVSNLFLRAGQGFEQGFDLFDNPPARWDGDSAQQVSARAISWLRGRHRGAPFFLWVHYLDPHWTYQPGPPFDRAFDPGFKGPFTLYEDLEAHRLTKGQVIFDNRLDPRQVEHVISLYDGEIAQVDAALGALLDEATREAGGPLLTVLTSDHGESLGEQGYYFAHGEYLYNAGLRVPLIVSLAGTVPAGLRIPGLAQNIDVAPTILALLGIGRLQAADGRPLLLGASAGRTVTAAPGRGLIFAESDFQLIHPENRRYYLPGPAGKWSAVSDGRSKLILIPKPGGEILEFYDLETDPGERRNLEGAGADAVTRGHLLRELRQFVDYDPGWLPGPPTGPDDEERRRLRALGYLN
ncbi:MAG TPA: sulfatase, partial [Candidatus Polarisedimenticolia bacterium]|nr:sulfatase [Candidatus Polarisedimenticolia bacterium]